MELLDGFGDTGNGACRNCGLIRKWIIVDIAKVHVGCRDTSNADSVVEINAIGEIDQTITESTALVHGSSVLAVRSQVWPIIVEAYEDERLSKVP